MNGAPSVLFAEDEVMALGDGVTIERPASNFLATLRQLNAIEAPYLNAHSVALEFTEVL